MYKNCQQFNTDDSYIFESSKILEKLSKQQIEKEGLFTKEDKNEKRAIESSGSE